MTCGGNQSEFCGGPNRLNFYKKSTATTTSKTSTSTPTTSTTSTATPSTTSTTTGPVAIQTAGSYSYKGCYSEATNGRALSDKATAASGMTVETCAAFCSGYKYMGVEYSTECYCGNTINAGSALATDGCSMTCGGNANEYCGGPNRLNFYSAGTSTTSQTTTTTSPTSTTSTTTSATATSTGPATVQNLVGYKYLGCYNELTNGRALSDVQNPIAASAVSVESCSRACSQYTFFGVEYSGECYCGNKIASGSALVAGSDPSTTQCNMLCNANSKEYCGGPSRLNMYQKSSASVTQSSTTTTQSSTTSSMTSSTLTSTTSSQTSGPTANPGNANFTYTACYTDSTASRTLPNLVLANNGMTISKCLAACYSYNYAAVEYGQ